MGNEDLQQFVFTTRERDFGVVAAERAGFEVDAEWAKAHEPGSCRGCRCGSAILPPQHSADAGQQLTRVEWLGEVIIGADLEADDAVDVLSLCRQHDDGGKAWLCAQPARDRQAILTRHHPVEHQQVGQPGSQQAIQRDRVFRRLDRVAMVRQVFRHQFADAGVVVGHVNGVLFHAANITVGTARYASVTHCYKIALA